jgi:hypothetical protein
MIDIIRAGDIMWYSKCVCQMHTRFIAENFKEF